MTKPQTTLEQLDELDRLGYMPAIPLTRKLIHDARALHQQAAVLERVRRVLLCIRTGHEALVQDGQVIGVRGEIRELLYLLESEVSDGVS